MVDKIYEIVNIDFWDLTIEAVECDLDIRNIPEEEVFRLEDFGDYKFTLRNGRRKVVDFEMWVEGHKKS